MATRRKSLKMELIPLSACGAFGLPSVFSRGEPADIPRSIRGLHGIGGPRPAGLFSYAAPPGARLSKEETMSKQSIVRRSLAAAVGGVAALTLIGGTAQAAESSVGTATTTKTAAVTAAASSTSYSLPYYGSSALMPTWWGRGTTVCAYNYGWNYGWLKVQSLTGAEPEYIGVEPGQERCIFNRWWWGVPVRTTNVANSPLYVSGF